MDGILNRDDSNMAAQAICHAAEMVKHEMCYTAGMGQRPSVLFRPELSIDGNKWCALYGKNLQDGVGGFGDSPSAAMSDFDVMWDKKLSAKQGGKE